MLQTTFAMIKTEAVLCRQDGEVMHRILTAGFTIERAKFTSLALKTIRTLYQEHLKKTFIDDLIQSVSGPVILLALSGDEAISRWRQVMGPTDPAKAGTNHIRYMFRDGSCLAANGVHGSDSEAAAERELILMFGNDWYGINRFSHMKSMVPISMVDQAMMQKELAKFDLVRAPQVRTGQVTEETQKESDSIFDAYSQR